MVIFWIGSRSDIEEVSHDVFERLWQDNALDAKRRNGVFVEIIARRDRATNPRYTGGESRYVKLLTSSGWHIGTLHEIVLPDGSVAHSHAKDYTRRDCSRIRPPRGPA
jgi:hypothetical protein